MEAAHREKAQTRMDTLQKNTSDTLFMAYTLIIGWLEDDETPELGDHQIRDAVIDLAMIAFHLGHAVRV